MKLSATFIGFAWVECAQDELAPSQPLELVVRSFRSVFSWCEWLKLAGECLRQCYSDNGQKAACVHFHGIGKRGESHPLFTIGCG